MKVSILRLAISTVVMALVYALALFLAAGTLAWTAGWVYLVLVYSLAIGLSVWLFRFNPGLLAERISGVGKPDQKTWDKVFLALMAFAFFGWLALMGLDAVRFRWSQMPTWLQWVGAFLLLVSFYIFYLTFRENSYLSPAVRVQTERGQTVVSTGPYQYVRHPMYAGFILYVIGSALMLESFYGLLGGALLVAMIAWRAVQEERVLERELAGYREYKERVRFRFVPYIW